jgi:chromosome segregation ATPase
MQTARRSQRRAAGDCATIARMNDHAAWASRVAGLERELADAREQLLERERQIQHLRRQLVRARGWHERAEPVRTPPAPPAEEARAEAERCLSEGIRLHRAGESKQATRLFRRGLDLVPGHNELLRALRRYC